MTHEFIQTGLSAISAIGVFFLVFAKSFLSEKGKNYATKKDIGDITRIIEDVKKQFNSDAEYLKNRLNIFSQSFHSIKTLERDALIEINKKYSEWLHSLTTFTLAFYNYDNYELLKEHYFQFSQKQKEYNVAEDNLNLYMQNDELKETLLNLTRQTRELQKSVMISISAFTENCFAYKEIMKIAPLEKFEIVKKEYNERQQPIFNKSIDDLIMIHKEIVKHQVTFMRIINHRIYQLIQE